MIHNWIKNKYERKLIYIALSISIIFFIIAGWKVSHRTELLTNIGPHIQNGIQHGFHKMNPLKMYAKDKGSLGRIGVFAAFILFPLYFLIRFKKLNDKKQFKKYLGKLLRWCKLIHVPISLITFALITVHSVIMTFFEWKSDAVYISGVITLFAPCSIRNIGFFKI